MKDKETTKGRLLRSKHAGRDGVKVVRVEVGRREKKQGPGALPGMRQGPGIFGSRPDFETNQSTPRERVVFQVPAR
jgi:hypothetical protein